MQQNTLGNIFIYNSGNAQINILNETLKSHSLQTFQTDNLYQLSRYSKEIIPQIMILNLQNHDLSETPTYVYDIVNINTKNQPDFPLIVLKSKRQKPLKNINVAHFLQMPQDSSRLNEIIDSYTLGHQNHDVLLLHSYKEEPDFLRLQFITKGYRVFDVHDERAAGLYLKKNNPRIVCIEHTLSFLSAKYNLSHHHIFYVDSQQDITEFEKFLR